MDWCFGELGIKKLIKHAHNRKMKRMKRRQMKSVITKHTNFIDEMKNAKWCKGNAMNWMKYNATHWNWCVLSNPENKNDMTFQSTKYYFIASCTLHSVIFIDLRVFFYCSFKLLQHFRKKSTFKNHKNTKIIIQRAAFDILLVSTALELNK